MRAITLLLLLTALLAGCDLPVTGPPAGIPGSGGGEATASVITVVPAITSQPGGLPGDTRVYASPLPPTPLPTLASASLTPTQLKYRVLDRFPKFFYCDPDYYPIARDDEPQVALDRFPELQTEQEEFQAIVQHLGLAGQSTFTDHQKLLIYREH